MFALFVSPKQQSSIRRERQLYPDIHVRVLDDNPAIRRSCQSAAMSFDARQEWKELDVEMGFVSKEFENLGELLPSSPPLLSCSGDIQEPDCLIWR